MGVPTKVEYNFPGVNKSSPDHPMAVRQSDGEKFLYNGVVSTLNSSTTPLGIGESFTGEAEDCSQYATVSVFAFTDAESDGDNLEMQFSTDGENWDYTEPVHVRAGIPATRNIHTVAARFFRVVYTNRIVAQTKFRIQSILHRTRDRELTVALNRIIRNSEDSTLFRAGSDFDLDISRGTIDHLDVIHKFGRNEDLGSADAEDIWTVGGNYIWETVPAALEAISTSALDTDGGIGARTIVVQGLDGNFDEVFEEITMNGLAVSAPTTATFIRVNRIWTEDAGSYHISGASPGGAAGDILVQRVGGGNPQGEILRTDPATIVWGFGQSQMGRYTVPRGKTGLLRSIHLDNTSAKPADMAIFQRKEADTVSAPFTAQRMFRHWPGLEGSAEHIYEAPLRIEEKTDVWARGRLLLGGGGSVTVNMEIVLHDGVH